MKLIMEHYGKGILAGIVFVLLFLIFYNIIFGGPLGNAILKFSNNTC